MDAREPSAEQFLLMTDVELRAAASNPELPANLLPALRAELRRRAVAPTAQQPWQGRQAPVRATLSPTNEPLAVRITDIEMSFGSMVVFMVKWTLASIPAMIILAVLTLAVIVAIDFVAG